MFRVVVRDLIVLVYGCLHYDASSVLRKLFLATVRTVPVYVFLIASRSCCGADDALHLDIVGSLLEVALCVVGWLGRVHALSDKHCKDGRASDRDCYQACQLCSSLMCSCIYLWCTLISSTTSAIWAPELRPCQCHPLRPRQHV
jgi:hypothetical protein